MACDLDLPAGVVRCSTSPRTPSLESEEAPGKRRRLGRDPKPQTLFLIDWDDTCLPYSWLQAEGLQVLDASKPSESQRIILQKQAACVARTLRKAKVFGEVVVVTNAEEGWVAASCFKFLPELLPLLEEFPVVSARAAYEQKCPGSPAKWKLCAFQAEIGAFIAASPSEHGQHNIVSIGDSMHEHEALYAATSDRHCWAKSMKFLLKPSVQDLINQHAVLEQYLEDLASCEGNFDVYMEKVGEDITLVAQAS
mmetsp:Transcript_7773/g.13797  ORF Transcript_7773/g.13797 Transcript_7773/m.13797 type:complete len:252 (+) Transcript_7773:84-839(+)|eukprot:CAMPEP_0197627038 /NCGR_PEP_ID=MMETSP1338-20131121/5761_1 /TAXON_ID=43686 ORGANISM="Pelagodinium beii, Strain RCC1491" /NCGR_SAMPLE_ID=MMETSP1338 /ASSEMBLY_ACC=CAM_ASM_000754 /LENGTH=251 /DNA_ID=CAMNT_0043197651 /DNA_START=51 /DNA_END=806 /DNA_ORIENTATION=+